MCFFALWPFGSYDPLDCEFLAGGMGAEAVIRNWIGSLGARVSRFLLLMFGFSVYPTVSLALLSVSRRLFWRRLVRPVQWPYWLAFLFLVFGGASLCGIWPDFLAVFADALNLSRLPGGVVGQRLCAPGSGWLRLVLNATGAAILSGAFVVGALGVLWLHDWHDLAVGYWRRKRSAAEDALPEGEAVPEDEIESEEKGGVSSMLSERWKRKGRLSEVRRAEAEHQEEKKGASAASATSEEPPVGEPDPALPASPRKRGASKARKTAYKLPGLDLLAPSEGLPTTTNPAEIKLKKEILQATLDSFSIDAQVGGATSGPRVTLFEVIPAPGVKVEKISQISNNIAMELRANPTPRILTPIPGKKSVGIEVANSSAAMVNLSGLLESNVWRKSKAQLPVLLGRDIKGDVAILDLGGAPHLLIAGATGSGKSVCINLLVMSLLYRFSPEELRLIMIDPKVVEFRCYESLPHLVVPVISDVSQVQLALRWLIREMERRYRVLAKVGVRNLETFNSRPKSKEEILDDEGDVIPARLPHIVMIIDELADIMMSAKADVETSLARIAQLSRAVGIHTIIATQRPSVNVITGIIKANFPTRIAFKVTQQVDSRTILDGKGAEKLLGQGDMLYRPPGASGTERIQGGYVSDEEIEKVVAHVAEQGEQQFDENVLHMSEGGEGNVVGARTSAGGGAAASGDAGDGDEELIRRATEVILRDRRATTSYVQRSLRIGYNRAAMIIDTLEERGVIGPQLGTQAREILIDGPETDDPSDDASL